jgi:hypothetical protein
MAETKIRFTTTKAAPEVRICARLRVAGPVRASIVYQGAILRAKSTAAENRRLFLRSIEVEDAAPVVNKRFAPQAVSALDTLAELAGRGKPS